MKISLSLIFVSLSSIFSVSVQKYDEMTTTFISENGDKAVTYSLVFEAEKIVEILQDCGFKEIKVNEITGKKLMGKNEYISPAITMATENKKCKLDELKIITTVICKK